MNDANGWSGHLSFWIEVEWHYWLRPDKVDWDWRFGP
jgi:hypothetical protein